MHSRDPFKHKQLKKVVRSGLQLLVIAATLMWAFSSVLAGPAYQPNDSRSSDADNGFIAVSYLAVAGIDAPGVVGEERLDSHLKALRDSGYETVTQQDITDYYSGKKQLPEKAMFLMFEDGRRDSAIYAQKYLEKYNYKASMLSYAQNLENPGVRFLSGSDLKKLEQSSYWELGSNGYRLAYINVFDRDGNHLGMLTPGEFSAAAQESKLTYNHYLMDYMKDADSIPLESNKSMKARIESDYADMKRVYTESVGRLPGLYAIMHSNSGQYGSVKLVSDENERWISDMFSMHFNREGNSLNMASDGNIYDMTRVQAKSYWPANHLLMRIYEDTGAEPAWRIGNLAFAESWKQQGGVAEFADGRLILTTPSDDYANVVFINDIEDVDISTTMEGNKYGRQEILLREQKDGGEYISIAIHNDILYISEKLEGDSVCTLIEQPLSDFAGQEEMDRDEQGSHPLAIKLAGDTLEVSVDGVQYGPFPVAVRQPGELRLSAAWGGIGDSEAVGDSMYDAIFSSLKIYDGNRCLFDNTRSAGDTARIEMKKLFHYIASLAS